MCLDAKADPGLHPGYEYYEPFTDS